MQFPESWLRTFCNPDLSTQQLSDLLTMAGLEVEELDPVAPPFTGVVVAQVLEVSKHPDADRLNVCKVDAGTGAVLQIVCGAPNVRPGIKVPCATVGAELPPGADGKPFKMPGIMPKLSATPGGTEWIGPGLGEHTERVLAALGYPPAQIARMRADGAI